MAEEENQQMVGKFFTSARKFQQVLGVFPDGTPIPGGPYTLSQFIIAVVTLGLGLLTRAMGLWGTNFIFDGIFIVGAAAGVGYMVGKLPSSRRSPFNMVNCFITLMMRPTTGYYRGKPLPRPSRRPKKTVSTKQEKEASDVQEDQPEPDINSGLDRLKADISNRAGKSSPAL